MVVGKSGLAVRLHANDGCVADNVATAVLQNVSGIVLTLVAVPDACM